MVGLAVASSLELCVLEEESLEWRLARSEEAREERWRRGRLWWREGRRLLPSFVREERTSPLGYSVPVGTGRADSIMSPFSPMSRLLLLLVDPTVVYVSMIGIVGIVNQSDI